CASADSGYPPYFFDIW
nr:immunoglobulin heavy chain junction region [Macaca mulatta]MOX59632.1 immunoglobulin heavy chain junction region [Macaca mulatta]MOX60375.1 immunoglobulin heavy chain junction region [Macaca mulatta]MOX60988.1 immunoglobulin heavy chain junction region [Macaca mulatta]MOX61565.1 immunoglobulin heavy chain junction region [Macaca mulatta]